MKATALIMIMAAGAAGNGSAEDVVRFRWLPDCGAESRERFYFSIEVRDDGLVRYEGHDGPKVIGSREARIDAASARRLRAKALSFTEQGGTRKESEERSELGSFCLEVSLLRGQEVAATNARRSDTRAVRNLLRDMDRRVGLRKWVCPASRISRGRLDATDYCPQAPVFSMTLAGRTACDVSQDLFVYADGTVYSLAYRSHGRSDRADRYYEIAPSAVDELVKSIRPLERAAMEVIEDPPGRTQKIYYRYKPEDVQSIRNRLAALTDIEWLSTSDAADCEQYPGPSSAIHLREDLDTRADE
jgi:hypothetical protein